jgi:hypothetical protein
MRLNLEEPRKVVVEVADALIVVRIVSTEEVLALRKKHTKTRNLLGDPVEELEAKAYSVDFWDAVIESWTGFEDQDGKDIPCDRTTKYDLVSKYAEIALQINQEIEAVRAKTFQREEALEKNV